MIGAQMRYLFFIVIIFITAVLSQAADISGYVRSSLNGAPVIGANVTLVGTHLGAATDYQGYFFIKDVPQGQYILKIQHVGYTLNESRQVIITADKNVQVVIDMAEQILDGESVVITATRTPRLIKDSPVNTEVIRGDAIRNMGAENVGEVLEERAGIIVTQDGARGGLLSAQLQGLDDNHTLVLLDGAPLIGRIAGKLDLSRVSVQNIDRIEIVKGAASALYGSEAVGGVINIITKDIEDKFQYGGNINFGSFNSRNLKLDFGSARGQTSYNLSAENHRADGYDLDPTTANTTADSYNKYSVFSKVKHQFNEDFSIQFSGDFFTQRQMGFDGGKRQTETENWYLNINPKWQLKDHSKFNARLYHTQYLKNIDRAEVRVRNIENLTRGEFIYNRVLKNHILTFGGEITDNRLETNRIEEGNKIVNNYSIYAQDEIFYRSIEFNLGFRADYHSQFDWNVSPKFGLLYKPTEKWRVRASYSFGFRAPDFIEMFLVLDHSGLSSQPYIAFGNPELKPESSRSLNLGSEYHFSTNAVIRTNLFYNTLNDMINSKFLYQTSDGVQYYSYENLSKAYTQGVELDLTVGLFEYFRLTSGYSFTETKDVTQDEPFFNRPKHSARFRFDWHFKNLGFSGNLRWRYIGERLFINFQGEETMAPWYATWYTRIKQRIHDPVYIYAQVENLLDYQNRNFVAIPGRLIYFGIEIN
jgi:outer membrane receptor for ferrienterochelin and colicins